VPSLVVNRSVCVRCVVWNEGERGMLAAVRVGGGGVEVVWGASKTRPRAEGTVCLPAAAPFCSSRRYAYSCHAPASRAVTCEHAHAASVYVNA